jgi:hypothetical protein
MYRSTSVELPQGILTIPSCGEALAFSGSHGLLNLTLYLGHQFVLAALFFFMEPKRRFDKASQWGIVKRYFLSRFLVIGICIFLSGCATGGRSEAAGKTGSFNLPKYVLQMQASATYAQSHGSHLPRQAYVFPALRIDPGGRPMDVLKHRMGADGSLVWDSPAPRAAEVKSVVEQALRKRGFSIVGFQALSGASGGHGVLVVNPYFTPRLGVEDQESIERVFVRLTGSTFPEDMNPSGKIDRFNQEAIVFFDHELFVLDVAKCVLSTLVQHVGGNQQWQDRLHILAGP